VDDLTQEIDEEEVIAREQLYFGWKQPVRKYRKLGRGTTVWR